MFNDERYLILHKMRNAHIVFDTFVTDELYEIRCMTSPIQKMSSLGTNKSDILQANTDNYSIAVDETKLCNFMKDITDEVIGICFVTRELYDLFYKRNKEYSDKMSTIIVDPIKSSTYLWSLLC